MTYFAVLVVERDTDGTTVLVGELARQAAVHGILGVVRDLGLSLLSVEASPVFHLVHQGSLVMPRLLALFFIVTAATLDTSAAGAGPSSPATMDRDGAPESPPPLSRRRAPPSCSRRSLVSSSRPWRGRAPSAGLWRPAILVGSVASAVALVVLITPGTVPGLVIDDVVLWAVLARG